MHSHKLTHVTLCSHISIQSLTCTQMYICSHMCAQTPWHMLKHVLCAPHAHTLIIVYPHRHKPSQCILSPTCCSYGSVFSHHTHTHTQNPPLPIPALPLSPTCFSPVCLGVEGRKVACSDHFRTLPGNPFRFFARAEAVCLGLPNSASRTQEKLPVTLVPAVLARALRAQACV